MSATEAVVCLKGRQLKCRRATRVSSSAKTLNSRWLRILERIDGFGRPSLTVWLGPDNSPVAIESRPARQHDRIARTRVAGRDRARRQLDRRACAEGEGDTPGRQSRVH